MLKRISRIGNKVWQKNLRVSTIDDEAKIIDFYTPKVSSSFRLMSVRRIDLSPSKKESKDACEEIRKKSEK